MTGGEGWSQGIWSQGNGGAAGGPDGRDGCGEYDVTEGIIVVDQGRDRPGVPAGILVSGWVQEGT